MAQKVAEEKAVAGQSASARAPAKSGKLVLVVGIVVLIISVQAVLTYFLMPKAPEPKTEDPATAKAAPAATPNGEDEADGASSETAEVSMGDFSCTNSTANPGMVVHINFKLIAVTAAGSPAKSLDEQLKLHAGRVRQLVGQIVRRSNREDLDDPNLSTIKRLIRQEVNRLLRNHKSHIIEVVISDITTMDQ